MPITVGEIKKALAKLDGASFSSREQFDNSILPLFGPLQSGMPGQTFRDLADILIRKGWATANKGKIVLVFPPEEIKNDPSVTVNAVANNEPMVGPPQIGIFTGFSYVPDSPSSLHLSFREIALLVHLHSNNVSRPNLGFESLIVKGLVEHTNIAEPLPTSETESLKQNIAAGKTQAVTCVFNEDFMGAAEIINDLQDAKRTLNYYDWWVYQLTAMGKAFMEDQPDSLMNDLCT